MEIKAKVTHNFETAKAFAHVTLYKKFDPKKRFVFLSVLRSVLLFTALLLYFFQLHLESLYDVDFNAKHFLITFVFLEFFFIAVGVWSYFVSPKVQYNSMGKMKDIVDEYLFSDESFTDTVISEEYNEKTTIRYTMIFQVYETSQYLFIYRSKLQAYIVDKSTIEGGTVEEIRNKLSAFLKDKYVLCKY